MSLTPMMKQYLDIKNANTDCILFYRLGDFYEMFFDDAEIASRELELVLTGRDCGLSERAPMCGVPFHAASSYINKLIARGYKVGIVEQLEEASQAKGLVKRGIIKKYTPGTYADSNFLDENKNNYLLAINIVNNNCSLAFVDVSTGEFNTTVFKWNEAMFLAELSKYSPKEIVIRDGFDEEVINRLAEKMQFTTTKRDSADFEIDLELLSSHFKTIEISNMEQAVSSAILKYIHETQNESLNHINKINSYNIEKFLALDANSRKNLELTETLRDKTKKGSLLWVLDKTSTAMGARQLRAWIERPLIDKKSIINRLDAVTEFCESISLREDVKESLKEIYDIERLAGKVSSKSVNAKELITLKRSISKIPDIKATLASSSSPYLKELYNSLDELLDIYKLLDDAIDDNPSLSVKEGSIIKFGYNAEIDKLKEAKTSGKQWLAALEARERELTGIKSLKVSYNKVFGYYIEIRKSNVDSVPMDRYIRKQTLASAERYITEELKNMENEILGAEEKLVSLEYDMFVEVREKVEAEIGRMQETARAISIIDSLLSLATVALENDYVKPEITDDYDMDIKNGRHPVIEKLLSRGSFISNDVHLNNKESFMLITGPNMGGKSTFMRQIALITIMAQIGSYIPAEYGKIGICDKVFTRIGASDDLASGKSTFMVEMSEVAHILNNATSKSLILLDEVGRGTSTFDGLSLAWALTEHLTKENICKAKTLFATHYHELTDLEDSIDCLKNYSVGVKRVNGELVFLHKIIDGKEDKSYGIEVAELAGIPNDVLIRAREILNGLEDEKISDDIKTTNYGIETIDSNINEEVAIDKCLTCEMRELELPIHEDKKTHRVVEQLSLDNLVTDDLLDEIKNIDILSLTPMDSMNVLYNLVNRVKKLK